MKIALLGPGKDYIKYSTKRLLEEAEKEFKKVELIPVIGVKLKIAKELDALYGKKNLKDYDYILPRIDSKRAETGHYIMRFLDHFGVKKPYSAETILIAHNKFITLEQLVKNGIPVPETYMTGSRETAKDILNKQGLPIILKMLSGFGGRGVMVMENKTAAESVIDTMKTLKQEILIEEFIENPGEDIRGMVAGDEVVAAFKRVAAEGEKRTNIKMGGKGVAFKPSPEMEEMAIKAAKAVKSRICAVDMIEGKEGPSVIEVNINPGLEGIEKATGTNVAQKIIQFVSEELKK